MLQDLSSGLAILVYSDSQRHVEEQRDEFPQGYISKQSQQCQSMINLARSCQTFICHFTKCPCHQCSGEKIRTIASPGSSSILKFGLHLFTLFFHRFLILSPVLPSAMTVFVAIVALKLRFALASLHSS